MKKKHLNQAAAFANGYCSWRLKNVNVTACRPWPVKVIFKNSFDSRLSGEGLDYVAVQSIINQYTLSRIRLEKDFNWTIYFRIRSNAQACIVGEFFSVVVTRYTSTLTLLCLSSICDFCCMYGFRFTAYKLHGNTASANYDLGFCGTANTKTDRLLVRQNLPTEIVFGKPRPFEQMCGYISKYEKVLCKLICSHAFEYRPHFNFSVTKLTHLKQVLYYYLPRI